MEYYINIVIDQDTGAREEWNVFYSDNHLLVIPAAEIPDITELEKHPIVVAAIKKIKISRIMDDIKDDYRHLLDSDGNLDSESLQEILDDEYLGYTIEDIAESKYQHHANLMTLVK